MTTLHPAGREYIFWTLSGLPSGSDVEVSVDCGDTWTPATRIGEEVRVLVAGPDATSNPPEAVVLQVGVHRPIFRVIDEPEHVIRYSPGVLSVQARDCDQ